MTPETNTLSKNPPLQSPLFRNPSLNKSVIPVVGTETETGCREGRNDGIGVGDGVNCGMIVPG